MFSYIWETILGVILTMTLIVLPVACVLVFFYGLWALARGCA